MDADGYRRNCAADGLRQRGESVSGPRDGRWQELAVRAALGAGWGRIVTVSKRSAAKLIAGANILLDLLVVRGGPKLLVNLLVSRPDTALDSSLGDT